MTTITGLVLVKTAHPKTKVQKIDGLSKNTRQHFGKSNNTVRLKLQKKIKKIEIQF